MSVSTQDMHEILAEQDAAWNNRPVLRRLYTDWYRLIARNLAHVDGLTVELGSGIGRFKEVVPDTVLTDVEPTKWTSTVVDAEAMPYGNATVANLVLFDVFHHLASAARFLDEAQRVLVPGGRIIVFDPYCSPVSTPAWKAFHHERVDMAAAPFEDDPDVAASPFASNTARATTVFYRHRAEVGRRWPKLRVVDERRLAFLAYPLSGGFTGRQLVPNSLYDVFSAFEKVLAPLASLLAFRCLVVVERA
jgi:SAM-dependent methyltransferase